MTQRSRFLLLSGMLLFCIVLRSSIAFAGEHPPPQATEASTYPAFDNHPDEHVVIAADPFDTHDKAGFLRVDYLALGFMPIRLIVTNYGDKPINLEQSRIHFITAAGDKVPAAEPEDVERRATSIKNTGKEIPLPVPIPMHGKPKNKDPKIEADFHEFEYQAIVVEAHTTRAGFLFYDVQGLENPLRGAKLYLRQLKAADGKDLFYFEIPFDKYLAAQPK